MTREIGLGESGLVTLVDDGDHALLSRWHWGVHRSGVARKLYAKRDWRVEGKRFSVLLHNVLIPTAEGFEVDHRDGDGLNNTRRNLRVCTHAENIRNGPVRSSNTSGYQGVYWHRRGGKWRAKIVVDGWQIHLGTFDEARDAAVAYNEGACRYHGDFARLNEIPCACGLFVSFDTDDEWTDLVGVTHSRERCYGCP